MKKYKAARDPDGDFLRIVVGDRVDSTMPYTDFSRANARRLLSPSWWKLVQVMPTPDVYTTTWSMLQRMRCRDHSFLTGVRIGTTHYMIYAVAWGAGTGCPKNARRLAELLSPRLSGLELDRYEENLAAAPFRFVPASPVCGTPEHCRAIALFIEWLQGVAK